MATTIQFLPRAGRMVSRQPYLELHLCRKHHRQLRFASDSPISRRKPSVSDPKKPPSIKIPLEKQSRTVWAPRLRISVGVVFVGALIYSMVRLTLTAPKTLH